MTAEQAESVRPSVRPSVARRVSPLFCGVCLLSVLFVLHSTTSNAFPPPRMVPPEVERLTHAHTRTHTHTRSAADS